MRRDRRAAVQRQAGRCFWCDRLMLPSGHPGLKERPELLITMDHLHPRTSGGSNLKANLVAACMRCNKERGHRSSGQWDVDARLAFWQAREGLGEILTPDPLPEDQEPSPRAGEPPKGSEPH